MRIALRCCGRVLAAWGLFAAIGIAATTAPSFYARREYGNDMGCAGQVSLAVADINKDGIPDIVCGGGQFLLGRGNGTFYLSPEYGNISGADVVVPDLNGDGNPDWIVTAISGRSWGFSVAFGQGNGTFSAPTFYPISDVEGRDLVVGDFNGDGIIDAITLAEQGVWLMTGKGAGLFNAPVLAGPPVGDVFFPIRAADLNKDGKLDLIVSSPSGFTILFGNGNGTFQTPVNYTPTSGSSGVTVADLNGDGYLDVICPSENGASVAIYLGKAGGQFSSPRYVAIPSLGDVEVGDVNGDGIPDLVSDSVAVAYGIGKGYFSKAVSFSTGSGEGGPTQVVLAHLRSSKVLDVVTNDAFTRVSVLLNRGNGTFIEGVTSSIPSGFDCGVQADFNNDGIPDFAFVQNGNSFSVMYGTGNAAAPFVAGPSTPAPAKYPQLGCPTNTADINGDGIPDVLITVPTAPNVIGVLLPMLGVGDGTFVPGVAINVSQASGGVNLVDVNGDGKADYINQQNNQVSYGNGDGTFQQPVTFISNLLYAITDVKWADLNGDGKLDFVVQGGATYVLLSNGSGGLTQTYFNDEYADCYYVALGDLNGDGVPDLLLGSALDTMAVYVNDGKGNFPTVVPVYANGMLATLSPVIVDLNGDGKLDIAVGDGEDVAVITNLGNLEFGSALYFGEVQGYGAPYYGNWHGQAASAGMPDILTFSSTGSAVILVNTTK